MTTSTIGLGITVLLLTLILAWVTYRAFQFQNEILKLRADKEEVRDINKELVADLVTKQEAAKSAHKRERDRQDQVYRLREQNGLLLEQAKLAQKRANEAEERAREIAAVESFNYMQAREKEIRADALKRQRAVTAGQDQEIFAPFKVDLNPKDFHHVGGSVDYIVYDGASEVRAKTSDIVRKVYLLEIKTGRSQLNTVQRRIRDAVEDGRVAFATYHMDSGEMRTWEAATQCTSHTDALAAELETETPSE